MHACLLLVLVALVYSFVTICYCFIIPRFKHTATFDSFLGCWIEYISIGCELLKNLVLTGFEDITIIDLDTIDISNLNRSVYYAAACYSMILKSMYGCDSQFLFRKTHVGKSKAEVAREAVRAFNPNVRITHTIPYTIPIISCSLVLYVRMYLIGQGGGSSCKC